MEIPSYPLKFLTVFRTGQLWTAELRQFTRTPGQGQIEDMKTLKSWHHCSNAVWSGDGTRAALLIPLDPTNVRGPSKIQVIDSVNGDQISVIHSNFMIRRFYLSNHGNFLLLCFTSGEGEDGNNLLLYDINQPDQPLLRTKILNYVDNWPTMKITNEESFLVRKVNDGVQVFVLPEPVQTANNNIKTRILKPVLEKKEFSRPAAGSVIDVSAPYLKIDVPGITCFEAGPEKVEGNTTKVLISVFQLRKNAISVAKLYSLDTPNQPLQSYQTQASEAQLTFSDFSTCLFEAKSVVANKNKSYYGTSTLHVLTPTRSQTLVSGTEAPLHGYDVRKDTGQILFAKKNAPIQIKLVDAKSSPVETIVEFGDLKRNHFRMEQAGTWTMQAGFGGLAGDLEIYDLCDGMCLGSGRHSDTVVAEWLSDGRHILLATTSPRMRVSNKIKILRYNCDVLYEEDFEELTHALVQPMSISDMEERWPRRPKDAKRIAQKNTAASSKSFVPKHLRNEDAKSNKAKFVKAKVLNLNKASKGKANNNNNTNAKLSSTSNHAKTPNNEQPKKPVFKLPF